MRTLREMNDLFIEASKLHAQLRAMNQDGMGIDTNYKDSYWILHDQLKNKLYEILLDNFVFYSKPRLLKFLSLCSAYRPMEPHQILTRIAAGFEENYP